MRSSVPFLIATIACPLFILVSANAPCQAGLPKLVVDISPDHPLLLFRVPDAGDAGAGDYAQIVTDLWTLLPADLKPYSVLWIDAPGVDMATRHVYYREVLGPLQTAGVPVALTMADGNPRRIYPLDFAEELITEFANVKGIHISGLQFNEYYEFGNPDPLGVPPQVQWLSMAIDLAGRLGRFVAVQLDELHWPRVMANQWCRPLYDKIEQFSQYVVPVNDIRGPHNLGRQMALLGLWLEGAVANWGVGPRSSWYHDVHYLEPDVFGIADDPPLIPSSIYRAMILTGAMAGATAYSFSEPSDLWFGDDSHHWNNVIRQTLTECIERGFIARKQFVREKTRMAYQMKPAVTSLDFHRNLRDLDAVYDRGLLLHGVYGMEQPGQVAELVPNSGQYFWIPALSPYARQEALEHFVAVVSPGRMNSAEDWADVVDQYYAPENAGTAFISRVGRAVFVMHNRENAYEEQNFQLFDVPAPLRNLTAERVPEGVRVAWPFREGDVAFTVYRRVPPDTNYTRLARDLDDRYYIDRTAGHFQTFAYAVVALTNETEPFNGTVNYGDYLAVSTVESRIEDEVVLPPGVTSAVSGPTRQEPDDRPAISRWWPNTAHLPPDRRAIADAIAQRIQAWDWAFVDQNLDRVMDLYSEDYEDPQGWRRQYARRAYQWFFERYETCHMDRQIRAWDFSQYAEHNVVVVDLYCRFHGVALTDSGGRFADAPAEFPRYPQPLGDDPGYVRVTFTEAEGPWRILTTVPAVPNFKDILNFSTGPYDSLPPGPDQ